MNSKFYIVYKKKPKEVKPKEKTSVKKLEDKLWNVFSEFIRIRDADKNGNCKCFTCPNIRHWTKGDCGHGIPRQHKATKFNEQNNHFQCKHCNGFEQGMREIYKQQVDKRYGVGTWDQMLVASRQTVKWSAFELETMTKYYTQQVKEMKKLKFGL